MLQCFEELFRLGKRVLFAYVEESEVVFDIAFDGHVAADLEIEIHDRELFRPANHFGE